jgi:hypothetical protein
LFVDANQAASWVGVSGPRGEAIPRNPIRAAPVPKILASKKLRAPGSSPHPAGVDRSDRGETFDNKVDTLLSPEWGRWEFLAFNSAFKDLIHDSQA